MMCVYTYTHVWMCVYTSALVWMCMHLHVYTHLCKHNLLNTFKVFYLGWPSLKAFQFAELEAVQFASDLDQATQSQLAGKGWEPDTSQHFKPFLIQQESRLNWLSNK
eukprot:jgi/Botrbrau1/19921/Bobra.0059s0038.1